MQPSRVDDFAGALTPEQLSFKEVLFTPAPGRNGFRRAAGCALVRQQSFEHIDRGCERRTSGTVLGFAIPPTIVELLTKQTGYHPTHILTKIGAQSDDPAIDAWFDLAAEERLPGVLPTAVVSDQRHHAAHPVRARVNPEIVQQLKRWQRGGPWLAWELAFGLALLIALPALRRKARASRPQPIFVLQAQQSGSPSLTRHPHALRRNNVSRCMREIAQHLPADGRIRIEQPLQYRHAAEYNNLMRSRVLSTSPF